MAYEIVVCVKQVPDTENLTADAMKEDGTVNRSALPAIVNPEDLNALELAVEIKERFGGRVTAITMGPPGAAEALRQCLYRGADEVLLLTDRKFAASDTLATSYALAQAIKAMPTMPDIVLCGRQAIDGDTAQIGPQLAEKLDYPQFTYVEQVREMADGKMVAKRGIEGGYEVVRAPLPILLTVSSSANEPRPPAARRLMRYKKARSPIEMGDDATLDGLETMRESGLLIRQLGADDIGCNADELGGKGSPTRVKKIESVKLITEEHKRVEPTADGLTELVEELIAEHIFE